MLKCREGIGSHQVQIRVGSAPHRGGTFVAFDFVCRKSRRTNLNHPLSKQFIACDSARDISPGSLASASRSLRASKISSRRMPRSAAVEIWALSRATPKPSSLRRLNPAAKAGSGCPRLFPVETSSAIDGWMAYGAALNEGRALFNPGDDKGFGQWLYSSNLEEKIHPADKSASMWAVRCSQAMNCLGNGWCCSCQHHFPNPSSLRRLNPPE